MTFLSRFCFLVVLVFVSCNNEIAHESSATLFERISETESGIDFSNNIVESQEVNYFKFMHIYMGGGVSAGDINNDGLDDIYFSSNIGPNKLYLNKGEFTFEDVTTKAGVDASSGFKTGVNFVDINNDDLLDIYVCKSGWFSDRKKKENTFYINKGNLEFENLAEEMGLNCDYNSVQSSFFDFDRDGDLDMYLINTPVDFSLTRSLYPLDEVYSKGLGDKYLSRDILYENRNGKFYDISSEAGILNDIAFGLSVITVDFNKDGWPDIYVANDFNSPDYLYKNNQDGTFEEVADDWFGHTSFYSMGSDVGDINNDGMLDLFTVDMTSKDHVRSKTNMSMINPKQYQQMVGMGYHYQYMHNMMHLNTGNEKFSEISQLCDLDKTDWSWSALINDMDNNGTEDVYVTNGVIKDVTYKDVQLNIKKKEAAIGRPLSFEESMDEIPSVPLENYCFSNMGSFKFDDVSQDWGLSAKGFSNGAALADFDNDGDFDLVTNNHSSAAFLYKNNSTNNFLKASLKGYLKHNAKMEIFYNNGQSQFKEIIGARGYFSSSSMEVIFGLGSTETVDSLIVEWSDGKTNKYVNPQINTTLLIDYKNASVNEKNDKNSESQILTEVKNIIQPTHYHQENEYFDFEKQVLLPHSMSNSGPFISSADVNGDDLKDFFIGGAKNQVGSIYIQQSDGSFKLKAQASFLKDREYEDLESEFLDVDQDGDLDLFVVSGGAENLPKSPLYQDRLYLNDGTGNFDRDVGAVPLMISSCQSVSSADVDNDGDIDLFVGGRIFPDHYPMATPSYLLINEEGKFKDIALQNGNGLDLMGMVTSSVWHDIDGDNDQDLIVVGEWMPITIFENQNGSFVSATEKYNLSHTQGWWNEIVKSDYDQDGDMDFIIGNLGLNHKFDSTIEKPFHIYFSDYDENGTLDVFLAKTYKDKMVPVRGKSCSSEQMPSIAKKFESFNEFANADLFSIIGANESSSFHLQANMFESIILENTGSGFEIKKLPIEAQFSAVNAIVVEDFNQDGNLDLLLGGNMYQTEVETSRADASVGTMLLGNSKGEFDVASSKETGLFIPHDVKSLELIDVESGKILVVGNNDNVMQLFKLK